MSSSDDDLEFFDASPVVSPEEPVARRGNRRKAHTPSPNKVPRKKQREVLRSANGEVAKVDDDDDNEEGNRRNPRRIHQHQIKRKRTEASPTESILEDDYDRRSSASSEMENRPPPPSAAAVLADEIPEESSQPVTNVNYHHHHVFVRNLFYDLALYYNIIYIFRERHKFVQENVFQFVQTQVRLTVVDLRFPAGPIMAWKMKLLPQVKP